MQQLMRRLANKLHLKPHKVRDRHGEETELVTAGDVEGHLSHKDARLYLVDLARILPPIPPRPHTCDHLVRQFRPEFLRLFSSERALSSDAYSRWGAHNQSEHNLEIVKTFSFLVNKVIPDFARYLVRTVHEIIDESGEEEGVFDVRKHEQKSKSIHTQPPITTTIVSQSLQIALSERRERLREIQHTTLSIAYPPGASESQHERGVSHAWHQHPLLGPGLAQNPRPRAGLPTRHHSRNGGPVYQGFLAAMLAGALSKLCRGFPVQLRVCSSALVCYARGRGREGEHRKTGNKPARD